jgi:hypothetical protein
MFMKNIYLIALFSIVTTISAFATHLVGGEIRSSHTSGLTYNISVVLYFDSTAPVKEDKILVCTGDGSTITVDRASYSTSPDNSKIGIGTYTTSYTYASQGIYQISTQVSNRANGVVNFPAGEQEPLFLWSVLNTSFLNSAPVLAHSIFEGGVNQPFILDLKATDTESDSISFSLHKLSKPSPGTCGVRSTNSQYMYPNDVSSSGTFKIDNQAKQLRWLAPTQTGKYIVSFIIYEWRDGIRISENYREFIVNVTDRPGESVEIPPYESADNLGPVTGIPNPDNAKISIAINAYPVPTTDFLTVKVYSSSTSVISLQILDIQGRVRETFKTSAAESSIQHQFDLRNYTNGIYLIKASNDKDAVTKKIVR